MASLQRKSCEYREITTKRRPGDTDVFVTFDRNLWQECLDDCVGDEADAKKQYDRIMQSVARQQENRKCKRRRRDIQDSDSAAVISHAEAEKEPGADAQLQPDSANLATEDSASSDSDECPPPHRLEWCRPGELSLLVGVSHSVLRSWAKSKLVQTMVSAGGHRLYNIKSVKQHIKAAKESQESSADAKLQRQLLVYVRLDDTNRDQAQLEAVCDRIKNQVMHTYKHQCSDSELESCVIIVELESDAKRAGLTAQYFSDTPGTRKLLRTICSGKRTLVVLRAAEDISSVPSTYAFFLLLCRNTGTTVEVVPELFP